MSRIIGLTDPNMGVRTTVECPNCRAKEADYFDCYMGGNDVRLICKSSYKCRQCGHRWVDADWRLTNVVVRTM